MSADCYGCLTKVPPAPSVSWAKTNTPVGVCLICHALACGFHGWRNPMPPSFHCMQCKPLVLSASAAALVNNLNASLEYLKVLMKLIPKEILIKTLNEFLEANNELVEWLSGAEDRTINWKKWKPNDSFRLYFKNSDNEVTMLLIGAGMLIKELYKDGFPENYPKDLILLSQSIDDNNSNNTNEYEMLVTR